MREEERERLQESERVREGPQRERVREGVSETATQQESERAREWESQRVSE
jgi:hypothetical protein